jgi:hypothetical protein
MIGERVDPNPLRPVEEKDQSMRSGADLQHLRRFGNWLHPLELLTNPRRLRGHCRHYFSLIAPDVRGFLALIFQLAIESALGTSLDSRNNHGWQQTRIGPGVNWAHAEPNSSPAD